MIVAAGDLPAALRAAASSAARQRILVAARRGAHRARAAAARFPFLDVRVVALDDEALARALAGCVPSGCDGVVVPGEPRLARLLADRTGCRWSAGSAARLRRREVRRPWVMAGALLAAAPVRALIAARAPAAAAPRPPAAPAGPGAALLPALLRRMEHELDPGFGADDGPPATVQPDAGWSGRACADLRGAQRLQRRLVAAGAIAQRQGRVLRIPAGLDAPCGSAPPPAAAEPPAPRTILLHAPGDAAAPALLRAITAAMLDGARSAVVQPLGDLRDREDLAEDLRLIARRCPFLDLHLAEAVDDAERAAILAPLLGPGPVRLCGADRGGLAALAEHLDALGVDADPAGSGPAWDADDWSDDASAGLLAARRAAALADRSLMPEPWQEVAQAIAQGEAHHGGGGGGETVAAGRVVLGPAGGAAAAADAGASDLAAAPISPQAALQVEPVPAAEALAHPQRQAAVLAALQRGLDLLTGLPVLESPEPGWIGLRVPDPAFMLRAVVAQGVLARRHGGALWLPAGPAFGLRREVRSILAAVATAVVALGELRAQRPAAPR